jgi:fatty-acyl-CoA synthase
MLVTGVCKEVDETLKTTGFDTLIDYQTTSEPVYTDGGTDVIKYRNSYSDMSLKEFVERKAEISPDLLAVSDASGEYTWEDMNRTSDLVARELMSLGVRKGSHVALCGANSANWIITFYGIQKLGAIALLINSSQSAKEIARTARIGDVTHFCYGELAEMTEEEPFLREVTEKGGFPLSCCYSFRKDRHYKEELVAHQDPGPGSSWEPEADDPAVMLFTSGSTGLPKGVLLSAHTLILAAYNGYVEQTITETDKTCLIIPLFHVFGMVDNYLSGAIAGAPLYIPPDIHTSTILELVEREQCTFLHSVPTMLLALVGSKHFDPEKVRSIRATMIAGAATTEAQLRMLREKMPENHFFAAYGLSELAPVTRTLYIDDLDHVYHTVGLPCIGVSMKIVNPETGEECPTGEAGEICVQGSYMMCGYYKVSMEEQRIDADGWLHTGDRGYLRTDGYLCFTGRFKEMIMRGGENIMPMEIEREISALDGIANVRVVGVPSEFYEEEVCACIIPKEGAVFDVDAARKKLRGHLAKFKIPSFFVLYDAFPLLGSGKVDTITLKKDVIERIKKLGR